MTRENNVKILRKTWKTCNATIVLLLLLVIFLGYTLFIATNLGEDIVPDEPYHFSVSKSFSATWAIPENVPTARSNGVYVRQNPYLAYWIFGRALNLLNFLKPAASRWQQLVFLRIVNVLFSVGTVLFTYLFSKELIKHKWWQLLPVFALTNTLMFVLLSGGVSYDNLINFLSIAGLYFLLRVLQKKKFLINSLAWMIFIALGTLAKETVLPLALAMGVVWVIFIIKNRPKVSNFTIKNTGVVMLGSLLLLLIIANFRIYGINLIRHQSITPSCSDYFSSDLCDNTGFAKRREEMGLPEKLTVFQAFRQGYPEPLRYAFDTWIRAMLMKIFGIMGGQKSYYPIGIVYYQIIFYWMLILAVRYVKRVSFKIISLAGIIGFYALVLFIKNYDIELAYGFIQVAHQGRYIFPVISLVFALISYGLMKVPNKLIRNGTLLVTSFLFLYGGPIRFILYYNSVFVDWFS